MHVLEYNINCESYYKYLFLETIFFGSIGLHRLTSFCNKSGTKSIKFPDLIS